MNQICLDVHHHISLSQSVGQAGGAAPCMPHYPCAHFHRSEERAGLGRLKEGTGDACVFGRSRGGGKGREQAALMNEENKVLVYQARLAARPALQDSSRAAPLEPSNPVDAHQRKICKAFILEAGRAARPSTPILTNR